MAEEIGVTEKAIEDLYASLKADAASGGYYLNPDTDFVRELACGLIENEKRYGYWACPCRLACGKIKEDTGIICPCDYRDPDLSEYGCCYCALYVSEEIAQGKKKPEVIPDRRFEKAEKTILSDKTGFDSPSDLPYPVLRCKVCGYLCAREEPPEKCPICKAGNERFERFM